MVYQLLKQSLDTSDWKRLLLLPLRRPVLLLALISLCIFFSEIIPMRWCLEGKEERRREVHVWRPDEEGVTSDELQTRLSSASLPLHLHTTNEELSASTNEVISHWPPFKTLFGLDLLSHHADLIARITIARMLGGISVERRVYLLKKPPLNFREVFWYNGDRLQTHLFLSYPESPFLLYWLRTYRERRGVEMSLSKLKVRPEILLDGGILESNCSWEKELDKVMTSEELLGIRLAMTCPTSAAGNFNEL